MFLKQDRCGTGGLLFIFTSMILAVTMIGTVTFIRASTARSVAESVEHTIALQCLASCYTHPNKYGTTNTWTSDNVFDSVTKDGTTIDPLNEFNSLMTSYHLISNDKADKISMKYSKHDNIVNGSYHPSFEIQIAGWSASDTFWDSVLKITPNPAKVTIEDSYKSSI